MMKHTVRGLFDRIEHVERHRICLEGNIEPVMGRDPLAGSAMQESGGTTLSTNWKDIGAKKLTCEPPEGVKVKTFEQ